MKKYEGLYLTEYEVDWNTGEPTIWNFQRLKNGKKKVTKVKGFKPYFYVDKDFPMGGDAIYTDIFGKKVKKVIVTSPREIYPLRDHIKSQGFKHHEADIVYNNRFLIDEVEEIIPSTYKKFYLDIETLSEGGFPDVEKADQKMICMTIYNSFNKKYITWIWRDDFKDETEVTKIGETIKCSSEKIMLQEIINYIHDESPDVFLAWNGVYFDYKYMMNRMKKFDLNLRKMSPMNQAFVTKTRPGQSDGHVFKGIGVIKGIVLFDLLNYYRKVHKGELSSYSLNNVALEELGEEKTDTHHVIDKDWQNNYENVIKYNVKDVELMVKIDDKTGVFDFFDQMRTIAHVNIDDCKFYGRVVDMFILRYCKQKNIVLPSKKVYQAGGTLEGGHVMDPLPGLYKNVIVIDLNSIYPTLIDTFNLSPETRTEDGEIVIDNIKFTNKVKGIIPSVLDELGLLRTKFKGRMKELRYEDPDFKVFDMKQQAAKNLACTVYGVQALSSFRLNTDYVAQTITFLGRSLINWVKDKCAEHGYETIYQDTDSCFIKMNDDWTKKECIEAGEILSEQINKEIIEFVKPFGINEHKLGIEFEKLYKRFLSVAKKRYAGHVIWKDGKDDDAIQLVGLDAKRSDCSQISKTMQKRVITKLLKGEKKEEIVKYIDNVITEIKTKTFSEIAMPVKFEKGLDAYAVNIPRVRGARWANKNLNVNYDAGSKVLMLYVLGKTDAICFEEDYQLEDKNIKVDYSKMIEKSVVQKVRRIFDTMNWTKEIKKLETIHLKGNKLLDNFF